MSDGDAAQSDDGPVEAEQIRLLLKDVRDLARALEGTTTSRLRIAAGSVEVEIERAAEGAATSAVGATSAGAEVTPAAPGTMPVVAPLVGVFYRAPSPGAKPFVEIGDTVERGQTIGIVEAMKVMNEVTSDFRGAVVEILVENGEAVQYEQPLLLIDIGG
jgi:acetyl-CoA carboxylase biotin carboxyl carrier protein